MKAKKNRNVFLKINTMGVIDNCTKGAVSSTEKSRVFRVGFLEEVTLGLIFFLISFINIYFWLCWVFVAAHAFL